VSNPLFILGIEYVPARIFPAAKLALTLRTIEKSVQIAGMIAQYQLTKKYAKQPVIIAPTQAVLA
jgi:hypothetical protein